MRRCRNSSSTSFTNAASHSRAGRERERRDPVIWVNNEIVMKNNFTGVADLPSSSHPLFFSLVATDFLLSLFSSSISPPSPLFFFRLLFILVPGKLSWACSFAHPEYRTKWHSMFIPHAQQLKSHFFFSLNGHKWLIWMCQWDQRETWLELLCTLVTRSKCPSGQTGVNVNERRQPLSLSLFLFSTSILWVE